MTTEENIFDPDFDILELNDNFWSKLDSAEKKLKIDSVTKTDETSCKNICSIEATSSSSKHFFQEEEVSLSSPKKTDKIKSLSDNSKQNSEKIKNLNSSIKVENDYEFLDSDLFEEWNAFYETENEFHEDKNHITLSQAIEMVEKYVESEKQKIKVFDCELNNPITFSMVDVTSLEEKKA